MENRNKEDVILGALIVALAIFLIIYSSFLPSPGPWIVAPGAVPIGLSLIMGGLGIALIVQSRRKGAKFSRGDLNLGRALLYLLGNRDFQRALFAMIFILAFIFSIYYLQFYPASLLFIFTGVRIYTPRVRWYNALLIAVITVAGLFVIFSYIFGLPLRLGVFEYVLKLIIGRTYL